MRLRNLLLLMSLLVSSASYGQDTLFYDDLETSTSGWLLTGNWNRTTDSVFAGSYSLTESPGGNYGDLENSTATMFSGVDLATALDATVSFQARYRIELGFDTMHLEASPDGGATWTRVAFFSDLNRMVHSLIRVCLLTTSC